MNRLSIAFLLLALPLAACATTGGGTAQTGGAQGSGAVAAKGAMTCPISGEPVTEDSPSAMYGVEPVYCATVADARQFASLPKEKRAKLFAAQRAQAAGK